MRRNSSFLEMLEEGPVIAAVKDDAGLEACLRSDCRVVFILYGDVLTVPLIVDKIKADGKTAMVHLDLISGLSQKEVSVDYIRTNTRADGIITTKYTLVKRAKELGLYTVLRFFVIDSMAYDNIARQCAAAKPDCIEILPGVMPKVMARIAEAERTPVIAGGLIADKEDIMAALQAGAVAVSSTNTDVWKM